LTTDVIVGFPGETDADFAATCRMAEEIGFSKIHIFRFSPRAGTSAAAMPDQIPPEIKHRRAAELAALERQLRIRYLQGLLGRELQVLVEEPHRRQPGVVLGTSARYAPVELPSSRGMPGQLVEVRAQAAAEDRILAA
ncbi:MAG: tRNA (N(6)-L-threonylcarbamoyladenosine(37)-C(2))-methylthiotransferase MtaB, partial [Thermoguttaceae bacterium]|nr:tRNA (N(6)-L-threonylcarbamoyladenosine(37)-C(2))-methylthiotransferase MtaB [Thermoguttaceae bacterium]